MVKFIVFEHDKEKDESKGIKTFDSWNEAEDFARNMAVERVVKLLEEDSAGYIIWKKVHNDFTRAFEIFKDGAPTNIMFVVQKGNIEDKQ